MSEVQKETKDEPANILDACLCLSSLTPSGTVVDRVKVAVTKRPATTEHAFDVLVSQSPPFLTSSSWVFVKTSSGVLPSLLRRRRNLVCMDFFMYQISKMTRKKKEETQLFFYCICGCIINQRPIIKVFKIGEQTCSLTRLTLLWFSKFIYT